MDLIGEERSKVARAAAWLDASPAELVGLLVLLAGAVLATAALVWSALGRPDLPAPEVTAPAAEVGTEPGDLGDDPDGERPGADHDDDHDRLPEEGAGPAPAAEPDAGEVTVHVVGHVATPGVVTLPAGARVADALDAAGGATAAADLTRTNLARIVDDGELVHVLAEGEEPPAGVAGPVSGSGTGSDDASIDLNRASVNELESLPGIGPTLAERIVDHRETHGPFTEPGQLRDVSGIGEQRFQDLADRVHVG